MRQFVFAGFPTTKIFAFLDAWSFKAFPVSMNIFPLSLSKSALSYPGALGLDPTKKTKSASLNPTFGSEVITTLSKVGKAQSCNSIYTPFNTF